MFAYKRTGQNKMTRKIQRLELTWSGKENRFNPEPRILIEDKKKSFSYSMHQEKFANSLFSATETESKIQPTYDNMLIHGDNLLALKALEQDYTDKIKCIYIDPPYNTGYAFKQYDDGLEHSIWLSLMRDRLEILRRLLSDDGGIFVNIDENEHAYLKILMDEIFGRKNQICTFIWYARSGQGNTVGHIAESHEYILFYGKDIANINVKKIQNITKEGNYHDELGSYKREQLRQWGQGDRREDRPSMYYPVKAPDGSLIYPKRADGSDGRWRVSQSSMNDLIKENNVDFVQNETGWVLYKKIRAGRITYSSYKTILDDFGTASSATVELKQLFNEKVFDTPKPEKLISHLIHLITNPNDIVLDSFLGSGTTCAVAHKMGRRWIGIEMGDHVYSCCLPRLHKVIKGEDNGGITKATGWICGGGFKFYELASSLIIKDSFGMDIISPEYNADMLAEAMCKILGYHYKPDTEKYWKQGYSSEKSFIYTTTMGLQEKALARLAEEIGDNNLLICCKAFMGNPNSYSNITVKKIPSTILKKCEWGSAGYPLNTNDYTPTDKDFEFDIDR
ncbi:MAG: site-specific DNA-methyltransferase [Alphaproteobacteria bacterium]|nr:site-specific DNA-methyltransferase [Alphaproteobacteria bacterium]